MNDTDETSGVNMVDTEEPETIHDITYMILVPEKINEFAQSEITTEEMLQININPVDAEQILMTRKILISNGIYVPPKLTGVVRNDLTSDDVDLDNLTDAELKQLEKDTAP